MERCPNCGSPARPGAKFCTTCGYRFTSEAQADSLIEAETSGAGGMDTEGDVLAGWPSAPLASDARPPETMEPEIASAVVDRPEVASAEEAMSPWPTLPDASWPTPADSFVAPPEASAPISTESALNKDDAIARGAADLAARARAERLLTELQETLAEIGRGSPADLSGILSELDVALTPPEALAGDGLAELRDALFAARDNPRDVDTIVDLTRRIDALVALVIAYDRTIAAIERALPALRRVSGNG